MVLIIKIFQGFKDKKQKRKKQKEAKRVNKAKLNNKSNYITKGKLKKKIQNSQSFTNIKDINDNGLITLKSNQYAYFYKVNPIDLSLTNKNEQELFFHTLSKLYRLPFTIKAYKFDEKINLNINKENYLKLIEDAGNNKARRDLLINNHGFIETIENENMTSASSYYFAIIGKNKEALEKNKEEFELACSGIIPKLLIERITNKKNLIKIFCNMYFANNNLDQVIYYDFMDLVTPLKINEQISNLKFDDEEVQLLSIKNYPLFIEHGFLDRIINLPYVKASVTINESIEQYKLINILNSSFKAVLADYNSSKNLSDVTEMQTLMNNYKILIEQISANDEKIKDVSIVLAISGNKKQREELIKEIKRNAELYQIKVDVPKLRQMEAWQSYDLTDKSFKDYGMYLPTITLASTFFFTENYHNDTTGYLIGEDSTYGLPIFFDPFYLSKVRTNHNMGVIGTSGSGKSYLLKLMITNEFARGTKLFLFDIENELQKLCNRCGGEYIDLSSKSLINPLQVRYVMSDEEDETSILGKHLGFLENFFTTAFEDISEKELVVLIDIVEKFYNSRGINKKTSLEEFEKMTPKDYPIFSDLYAYLLEEQRTCENKELSKILVNIEVLLKRMVVGQDSNLFNGITTIDLSNNLVVFNLQELLFNSTRRLINTQMINLLTYLSNEIVDNKKKNEKFNKDQKMLIVLDEFHNYIDEDNPTLLKYFDQTNRRSRKYKTGIIIASQQPADFTNRSNILRHASAIFNNCQYQLTGMLKDTDVTAVEKLYSNTPLTETQKTFLSRCNQGQFLLNITNRNRLRVNVFATPVQTYYMGETDELQTIKKIKKGCWIDLVNPNEEDIRFLTDSLDVDTSFISYLLDDEEQPRIDYDEDNDITMVIIDVPIREKRNNYTMVVTIPLAILIIKDSYIVTVSLEECDPLKEFKHKKVKEFFTFKKTRFTIQILYRTATSYLKYLRNLNREIEKAESKMLKATSNRDLANLLNIEKSLVYMTTSLKSNEIVLERILKGNVINLYEEDNELLEDAIIENKQCIEMSNLYREILSSTTDSYATIISNNLNTIMKFLAGVTIVISIPTMVASFMGMNVPLGSLMTNDYAFLILIGLSLVLSLIVAYILKKKNML